MPIRKRCVECNRLYADRPATVACPCCEAGICDDCLERLFADEAVVRCGFCEKTFAVDPAKQSARN